MAKADEYRARESARRERVAERRHARSRKAEQYARFTNALTKAGR